MVVRGAVELDFLLLQHRLLVEGAVGHRDGALEGAVGCRGIARHGNAQVDDRAARVGRDVEILADVGHPVGRIHQVRDDAAVAGALRKRTAEDGDGVDTAGGNAVLECGRFTHPIVF
ncbi:acylase [Babesia caballi]|uniref:Acylase n=1 Tax=Babesia caballi TaxID=5871 RepID=A0AAV4LM41_BABCB|nr:acylase [Babesia caballi]